MNKEFDLTRQPQNTYSGSMPEPGGAEFKSVQPQPKPKEISPAEKSRLIRDQFERSNQARVKKGEKITPEELQTQRIMAESGIAPIMGGADVPPEDVIREIAEGRGGEFSEADINEALGSLGLTEEDLAGATLEQKINMIRSGETLAADRGGRRGEKPEEAKYDRYTGGYSRNETLKRMLLKNRAERDEEFNDIFAGVDATPSEFFREAFNPLTYGARYEEFIDLIRDASTKGVEGVALTDEEKRSLGQDLLRYQLERQARQSLHDANAILYLPSIKGEQLWDNMQQFDTAQADLALRLPGVTQMMDIYEQTLREAMAKNDGYLRPEDVRGEIRTVKEDDRETYVSVKRGITEEEAKKRFKNMLARGQVSIKSRDKNGNFVVAPVKEMADWEIDRTFTMARGMMIMTERLLSIAAESKLPKAGIGRFTSLFLQDVLQAYSPYIHLFAKYGVSEKSLAAYLYTPGGREFLDMIKGWDPSSIKEIFDLLGKDPSAVLDQSLNQENPLLPYLTRRNPNRAGDIYTWISWRVADNPDAASMSQEFLKKGEERMIARFKRRYNLPENHDFATRRNNIDYESLFLTDKQISSGEKASASDIEFYNMFLDIYPGKSPTTKGVEEVKKVFGDYRNEYSNWLGTGLRFEKLRGRLENLHSHEEHHRKEAEEARKTALNIFGKMVDLQSHRLYLVSADIRERMDAAGWKRNSVAEGEADQIDQVLADLALVESQFLNNRELFLDKGFTFDNLSLDTQLEFDIKDIPGLSAENQELITVVGEKGKLDLFKAIKIYGVNEAGEMVLDEKATQLRRERAMAFRQAIMQDFRQKTELYEKEFITLREYKHGYVLWSGDVPMDEFNASALGATGGFARRARDNKAQGAAAIEEIKLLSSLKSIKDPHQVIELMAPIYEKIGEYDTGKAKAAIAEKLEGIIKFYRAEGATNIPILGIVRKLSGRSSLAQVMYGKSAAVWEAQDINLLITEMEHADYITEEQAEHLKEVTLSTNVDVALNAGVTISQLVAVAVLLYLLKESAKE